MFILEQTLEDIKFLKLVNGPLYIRPQTQIDAMLKYPSYGGCRKQWEQAIEITSPEGVKLIEYAKSIKIPIKEVEFSSSWIAQIARHSGNHDKLSILQSVR